MSRHRDSHNPGQAPIDNLPVELKNRLAANSHDLVTGLEVAQYCALHGLESLILDVLTPLEPQSEVAESACRGRYRVLHACAHMAARNYVEAEEILSLDLNERGACPDSLYQLVQVKQAMREYESAAKLAGNYLEMVGGTSSSVVNESLFSSPTHQGRINTWLGEACLQTNHDDEAVKAFQSAVALDKNAVGAYVGLVRALVRQYRRDEAAQVVRLGLEHCEEKHELMLVRDSVLNRPTISACMIVRNEEELLPGCLESIRDWVDEIIVVDTGSTDRTIEIAREYGARVFEQPWADDFSKHRNCSIEQASRDWIFIIDADERIVIDDVPRIIDALRDGRAELLSVGVYNVYGENEQKTTFANSIRFFRRCLNLRYSGIVHNVLGVPGNQPVLRTSARLKHYGYDLPPDRMKAKFERTRRLLEEQLKTDPDDVFALFNYAELLRGAEPVISKQNAAEVIRAATRVIDLVPVDDTERRHLRLMALNQLAAVLISCKEYEQALSCCRQALEMRPDYLDALIHAGFAYFGLQDISAAIAAFERYLEAQSKFDPSVENQPIILSYPDARDLAFNNLGALYELAGEPDKARQNYLKALRINPTYNETAGRLARLYLVESDFENAERLFRQQLSYRPNADALTGLAAVYFEMGRYELAESHYRQVVGQYGANSAVENDLGNCLYKQSRFGEAEQYYLQAVQLTPLEPLAFRNLALAQIHQGRKEEPLEALAHYLEHCPDDSDGWRLIADLHRSLGDCPQALDCYETALRLVPGDTGALFGLSECYLVMGHKDAAVLGYRRLLQLDPANRVVLERLGTLAEPVHEV